MIKINLTQKKSGGVELSNVGGLDLTKIKYKAVLIAIVIYYIPDFFVGPYYDEIIATKNSELMNLNTQKRKLVGQVEQAKQLEKQIEELKLQEKLLIEKLTAVKQALAQKKNPAALLIYVAKNTPDELWIKNLEIENDTMKIQGEAFNYTSIGTFVANMKNSVFIKDTKMGATKTENREGDKRRVDSFEVSFSIGRYEQ